MFAHSLSLYFNSMNRVLKLISEEHLESNVKKTAANPKHAVLHQST